METLSFKNPRFQFKAPFIDVFGYNMTKDGLIHEVSPTGGKHPFRYSPSSFFPSQPFYFAGIYVMGPKPELATARYKANLCTMGTFNHNEMRQIGGVTRFLNVTNLGVDCARLSKMFPFVYDDHSIRNGKSTHFIFPPKASDFTVTTNTSIAQRLEWFNKEESTGQALTDKLPGLNEIEVDNTISNQEECRKDGTIKVATFNAGRGTFWLEAANLLREADLVILNEMDIGMARSGQQHTTRHLAHMLGMNYAWGLEFVELTGGDAEEQQRTNGQDNFYGLHGNALLSRCKILDPVIFRDKVGMYFADNKNWVNAGGFEKRLGGRMGLYARIKIDGETVVVGSTHKLRENAEDIVRFIGPSKAISAGDQDAQFCNRTGLTVGKPSQNTWPASCTGFGRARGDNVCSNLKPQEIEKVSKPCLKAFGLGAELSDHAVIQVTLQL